MAIVQLEPRGRASVPVIIRAGQSVSEAFDTAGYDVVGISMGPAWTTASMTFRAAVTPDAVAGDFQDVYDDAGNVIVVQAGTGRTIVFGGSASLSLRGLRFLRIRSGTPAVPVVQAEDRTLHVIVRQSA